MLEICFTFYIIDKLIDGTNYAESHEEHEIVQHLVHYSFTKQEFDDNQERCAATKQVGYRCRHHCASIPRVVKSIASGSEESS